MLVCDSASSVWFTHYWFFTSDDLQVLSNGGIVVQNNCFSWLACCQATASQARLSAMHGRDRFSRYLCSEMRVDGLAWTESSNGPLGNVMGHGLWWAA
jgi:hypothetical protein